MPRDMATMMGGTMRYGQDMSHDPKARAVAKKEDGSEVWLLKGKVTIPRRWRTWLHLMNVLAVGECR